jgi:hypothetical protein
LFTGLLAVKIRYSATAYRGTPRRKRAKAVIERLDFFVTSNRYMNCAGTKHAQTARYYYALPGDSPEVRCHDGSLALAALLSLYFRALPATMLGG